MARIYMETSMLLHGIITLLTILRTVTSYGRGYLPPLPRTHAISGTLAQGRGTRQRLET